MSKAFKCDRCNKCFCPSDMHEDESYITIDHYWRQNRHDYAMHECWDQMTDIHLCPECTKIFVKFMKNEEENNNETNQNNIPFSDRLRNNLIHPAFDPLDVQYQSRVTKCCTDRADPSA